MMTLVDQLFDITTGPTAFHCIHVSLEDRASCDARVNLHCKKKFSREIVAPNLTVDLLKFSFLLRIQWVFNRPSRKFHLHTSTTNKVLAKISLSPGIFFFRDCCKNIVKVDMLVIDRGGSATEELKYCVQ